MRLRTLSSIALTAALVLAGSPSAASPGACSGFWNGNCEINNTGDQINITGTKDTPGSTKPGSKPGTKPGGSSASKPNPAPPKPPRPEPTLDPTGSVCFAEQCSVGTPEDTEPVVYPAVSASDLASFKPRAAKVNGEPQGVGVVGMPANVVAEASTHDVTGTLFGFGVLVRFVPEAYEFNFGDGTALTSSTGGASWAALRQAEFTPTTTSHSYSARGVYRLTVSVLYRASVLFDGTVWRDVSGQVRAQLAGYDIRVVTVSTALVDKTCIERPRGPGC